MGSVSDIIGELQEQEQKGLLRTSSSECSAACVFTDKNDVDENDYAKVYSSAIRHMSSGFAFHKIITDAQGVAVDYVFVEVNSAFEKLTGLKRNDIIGKKVTEVLKGIEHDPADWIGRYGDVALHDKTVYFESYSQILSRWYQVTAFSPVAGFFVTVFDDVSLGKNTKKLLDKKTSEFESIVTSLPGTAWRVDKNLVFTSSRGGGLDAMGLKQDEVVGMSLFQFFSTQDSSHPVIQNHMEALSGKTVEYEYTHNKSVYWAVLKPLYDVSGVVSGVSGLALDVTERKNTEQSLKESMQRYRVLFDSSPDSIAEVDEKGNCLVANQRMAKNLGVSAETLVGKNLSTVLPKEIAEQHGNVLKKVLEDGKIQVVEDERAGKHFYNTYVPISHSDGTKTVQVIARDVTEQKKAEETLRTFKESLDCSADAIGMSTPQGEHYYQNKAFDQLFGDIGKAPIETVYVDKNVGEDVFRAIMSGGQWTGELQMYARDRQIRDIFLRAYANKDEAGNITSLVGIHTDITERKKAETALKVSENKYRTLVDTLQEGIWALDKDANTSFVNPCMAEMLGYIVEEMQGKHLFSFMDEHGVELAKQKLAQRKQGIKEQHEFEFIKKDGTRIYTLLETSPLLDENGCYAGAIAGVIDITKRKKSEQEIRYLKEYNESILESNPNPMMVLKGKQIEYVNKSFISSFGKNKNDYLSKNLNEVFPDFEKVLQEQEKINELKIYNKIFCVFSFLVKKAEEEEEEEEEERRGIILHDITERKRLEIELTRAAAALDSSISGISFTDLSAKLVYVNPAFLRMWGYDAADETLGRSATEFWADENANNVLRALAERGGWSGEMTARRKDGSMFPVLLVASSVKNAEGEPIGLMGSFLDITERKQAENSLLESEERHRVLYESSCDAIMTLEPPTWTFTSGNPATVNMFRAKNEEEFISFAPGDLSPPYQPDGRPSAEKAKEMIEKAMQEGSNFFEWTHKRIDGEEFPATVLLTKLEMRGKQFLQATVRNITEQKKARQEILDKNTELEMMNTELSVAREQLALLNMDLENKVKERTSEVEQLLKQKDEFIDQLGHDLKTPLTPLNTLLPIIRKREQDQKLAELLDATIQNVNYMKNLVVKTLQLARLNSPNVVLTLTEFPFASEINTVLQSMQTILQERGILVESHLDDSIVVNADVMQIKELIANLLSNAIKYTPSGGKITITTNQGQDVVTTSIKKIPWNISFVVISGGAIPLR